MVLLVLLVGEALAQVPVAVPTPGRDVPQERQGGDFGLGLGVGAPTGLVGKLWLGDWSGLQFSAGGDLGRLGEVVGTGDYVIHFRPFHDAGAEYSVPIHLGAGVNVSYNHTELGGRLFVGPRAVFGADVLIRDLPVDLFVEVAPTFYIYDELTWSFDGQIGSRYYF